MLRNVNIFLNQLSAATDRICSLEEEQQQLREQNELIRERSEKSVEVRSCPWVRHPDCQIRLLPLSGSAVLGVTGSWTPMDTKTS